MRSFPIAVHLSFAFSCCEMPTRGRHVVDRSSFEERDSLHVLEKLSRRKRASSTLLDSSHLPRVSSFSPTVHYEDHAEMEVGEKSRIDDRRAN